MRERVLNYIRKHALMRPGDRVGVAVSGGADSVALLRLLLEARAELGIVLSVVHFNHKIRGADADADEQFVRDLARGFDLQFHCDSGDTPACAREHKLSLEAAARKLRYAFFARLTADSSVHRVATAHTRDDQAETVLMRFLRGSGTRGLAGIHPELRSANGAVVRPLLDIARDELRAYLHSLGQSWREDASNADVTFARNRLRHEIMPLLRQLNPNLDQVLSDTAEIAREEEIWWNQQTSAAQKDLWSPRPNAASGEKPQPLKMQVNALLSLPVALQRRIIRAMAEVPEVHLEFRHVEAVRELAASEASRAQRCVELPNDCEAVRQGRELWFRRKCQRSQEKNQCALVLKLAYEVQIAGRKIRASLVCGEELAHARARVPHGSEIRGTQVLLHADLAQQELRVRNWHAGDRYQPAHTSAPKKLKELLQARHIPREQKSSWPVAVVSSSSPTSAKPRQMWGTDAGTEEIVWVPGFAAPERFQVGDAASEALLLEELPLGQSGGNEP